MPFLDTNKSFKNLSVITAGRSEVVVLHDSAKFFFVNIIEKKELH